jgi:hypothetical protein
MSWGRNARSADRHPARYPDSAPVPESLPERPALMSADAEIGTGPDDAQAWAYITLSSTVKIMLRTGASSWRWAASAAVARPSGEANAARSSSMVSHSASATR